MVLDDIIKKLELIEQSDLFGIRDNQRLIVSSLEEKKGIEKLGKFYRSLENENLEGVNNTLTFSMSKDGLNCFSSNGKGEKDSIDLEIISYKTDFNKRNHGIIDPSVLQNKTVTVIGIGSGGSSIVMDLVRCGVTNLNLIEFDIVEISNLCRSVYDLTDIGKKKTDALYEKLIKINPCANIQIYDDDLVKMDSEKRDELIRSSDLIIEATDSPKSKLLINGLAYSETNVIYPAVYKEGKGGEILFTVPNATPCYECVFGAMQKEMEEVKSSEWNYTTGESKPMPSLISDIKIVADRTVKLSLALLSADSDNSFLEKVTEPDCNLLLIGNEADFYIFDKPFQEVWAETEVNPTCPHLTLC